jgi:hypothetical protein
MTAPAFLCWNRRGAANFVVAAAHIDGGAGGARSQNYAARGVANVRSRAVGVFAQAVATAAAGVQTPIS